MSTTLSTHPPQPAVERPRHVEYPAPRPTSRPNLVDKLALRLGLWLITYGRRRYAPTREEYTLQRTMERERQTREAQRLNVRWNLHP